MYRKQYKVVKSILTNVVNGYSRNELLRQKDNLNKYIEYCAENKHINKNNKVKNNIKETLILLELVNNALQYKDVVQTQTNTNKVLRDGRLIINHGGKEYTLLGVEINN